MLSALKFIAASVIVALFGGFLLAGVSTTPQGDEMAPAAVTGSPEPEATSEPTHAAPTSVRTDILPGVALTVEEVEPGVFHVTNDGVRDLVLGGNTEVVVGHDNGIWLLRKNQFFRLGSADARAWPTGAPRLVDFEVSSEGTLWIIQAQEDPVQEIINPGDLRSFDGEDWSGTGSPPGRVSTVEVAPDGTVWSSWVRDDVAQVAHLGPTGWDTIDAEDSWDIVRLLLSDSGDFFGVFCGWGCYGSHYEDGVWHMFDLDPALWSAMGSDGTFWHLGSTYVLPDPRGGTAAGTLGAVLARYADGAWQWWTKDDLPDLGLGLALTSEATFDREFAVAPDRSLWATLWQSIDGVDAAADGLWEWDERSAAVAGGRAACDGLIRFDGETLDHYLPGRCIAMDVAADGSVWILADEEEGKGLYVITPEAVTAEA